MAHDCIGEGCACNESTERLILAEEQDKLHDAAGELLSALQKCYSVFKELSDAGNYPAPLLADNGGNGFMFILNAIEKAGGTIPCYKCGKQVHPKTYGVCSNCVVGGPV